MKSIKELIAKNRQVIIFALVGCMNTAVDFGVYSLLVAFSPLGLGLCQTAGYSAGLVNSFVMNRQFTFRDAKDSGFSVGMQVLRFLVVNGVTLAISILCLRLLTDGLGMNPYLAKVPVTLLVMVVNYVGYKLFVFAGKERGKV